jgi:Tfp pilus assembly protein PilN
VRAVNLLPPDTRGASKSSAELGAGPEAKGGAGAFVVLGVLAACVAGVAGVVTTNNTIKQRTADLDAVALQQQAMQAQVTKLKPYADFDAMAKARAQTVRDLAGSRFDWEQALRDLSRAIPQDVTLRQLSGDISTDAGGTGGALRGAISAPAISITGCAPGQTQVARLMARLRDIDGVTRVSLSKSAAEVISASTEGKALERRRAAPCGSGKRPAFDLVMFFEGDASKVATTPVTATGTVSETPTPTPTATPEGDTATGDGTTTTTTTTTDGATK